MRVSDYPIIKFLSLFLIGFLFGYVAKIPLYILLTILILCISLVLIFQKQNQSLRNLFSILTVITFGAFIFSLSFFSNQNEMKILDVLQKRKVLLYGRVSNIEYFDKDKISFEFNSDSVVYRKVSFPVKQKLLVNLDLRESSFSLNYFDAIISIGNVIRISGTLSKPSEPLYPGDFNLRVYLKSKNINYILSSNNFDELNLIEANKSILNYQRYLSKLRQKIKFQIEQNFGQLEAAYIKGLFIAERSDIPENIKSDFINSGVIHVLAVSGLHTGYIVLILLALFGRMKLTIKIFLVSIGLFIFAHIANLSPSVIRASLMSVIILLNLLTERKTFLLNSISIAGLIILIMNPLDILNPSFQLSFSAVLSIALIYPVFNDYLKKFQLSGFKKYLIDLILISIAVSIGTFPFVASYYQKFSVVSLIANLIVIPLTGIILGGIILNLVILNLVPSLFPIYKIALESIINLNFSVVNFFGTLPFAYTTIRNFSLLNSIFYYGVVFSALLLIKSRFSLAFKFTSIALIVFNYVYHYDLVDDNLIDGNKNYLLLLKMSNSNGIVAHFDNKIFLKLFERSDSMLHIRKDLNKLNQILENYNFDKIQLASFSSPAIFLSNNLMSKLDKSQIKRLDDKIWLFGEISQNEMNENISSFHYNYIPNSFTELIRLGEVNFIISPVRFEKFIQKQSNKNSKFVYINPRLDTMFVKNNDVITDTIPLDFKNQRMKIFEIASEELKEIKW
ncbi:MAG: ComEC/Rec2 family competence protein [Ignavibacteria bacterium]